MARALYPGYFMVILDATIVNVALPDVGASLHGGLATLQWIVDGYTLAFAALLLTGGARSASRCSAHWRPPAGRSQPGSGPRCSVNPPAARR
jgi:MFS family permease